MAVLDTFFILFKSDASEVEKGTKKAGGAVDGLEKKLGGADNSAVILGSSFNKLATRAVAAFGSIFAVSKLISSARGIAAQSTELDNLGIILGESTAELTNWGRAVESIGGNANAFKGTLRGMNEGITDASFGIASDFTRALGQMDIGLRDSNEDMKTTLTLLPEIAKWMKDDFGKSASRTGALKFGRMLGLDEGTLRLLMQGEKGAAALVARQREMNTVTDDDTDALKVFNAKLLEYNNLISDAGTNIQVALLPTLQDLEEGFLSLVVFIGENEETISTFFKGMAVVGGLLAAPFILAAAKAALIGAAIVGVSYAVGLLVEDIQAYADGNDSAIGRAIAKWGFLANGIDVVKVALEAVLELLGLIDEKEGGPTSPSSRAPWVQDILDTVGGNVSGAISDAKGLLSSASAGTYNALMSASTGILRGVDAVDRSITMGDIIVHTAATNVEGIADAIGGTLRNEFQNTIDFFDNGVGG